MQITFFFISIAYATKSFTFPIVKIQYLYYRMINSCFISYNLNLIEYYFRLKRPVPEVVI
jgi:hypothetical protein